MSNKKKIGKKIKWLKAKRLHAENSQRDLLDLAELSVKNFLHWAKFYFPAQIFDDPKDTKGLYDVKTFQVQCMGYSFEENFDKEFSEFVNEIRKVTSLDEMSCGNICRKIPNNLRNDFKNLCMVGFEAYEAFDLLEETYKF